MRSGTFSTEALTGNSQNPWEKAPVLHEQKLLAMAARRSGSAARPRRIALMEKLEGTERSNVALRRAIGNSSKSHQVPPGWLGANLNPR